MEKAEEDPWGDPGGVHQVLHRAPGGGEEVPLKRYTEYVPLKDFEEIKAAVAQEVIPMRRYLMSDYRPVEVDPSATAPAALATCEAEASATAEKAAHESTSKGGGATRESGDRKAARPGWICGH
eukprot:Skav215500  [mRNA]  locus=scaffold165:821493:829478:- [translate_table: standard]